jgi:hypothetical protein
MLSVANKPIMWSVVMINVVMLSVANKPILWSAVMLNVIMLSGIMLSVIMLSVIMLSVIMLSVIMLSVAIQNVLAPKNTLAYFSPTVRHEREKIYEIDTRTQCYKTFSDRNVRILVIS